MGLDETGLDEMAINRIVSIILYFSITRPCTKHSQKQVRVSFGGGGGGIARVSPPSPLEIRLAIFFQGVIGCNGNITETQHKEYTA